MFFLAEPLDVLRGTRERTGHRVRRRTSSTLG